MLNPLSSLIGQKFHHTLVYYRNPKCASSSLALALGPRNLFAREKKYLEQKLSRDKKYQGVFDVTHITPEESANIFGPKIKGYFSFTCVRNPFDRTVSQYSFSRGRGWGHLYGVPDDGSFGEYCEILWKKRGDKTFWPVIPQVAFSHYRPLNYLIRFERLQQDWKKMIVDNGIHGLPDSLPHENKTNHLPWQELISPRAKEIIVELFARDFELLKYNTEIA
jgi:hypothetical protein